MKNLEMEGVRKLEKCLAVQGKGEVFFDSICAQEFAFPAQHWSLGSRQGIEITCQYFADSKSPTWLVPHHPPSFINPETEPRYHQHPQIYRIPYTNHLLSSMALNSFFHNKIESLELEIIERNSKLRRLEAQRNDYNSRGLCCYFRPIWIGIYLPQI